VTVQEAQEAARNVQQLFEIQKFAIDSVRRLVLIRDKASKVRMASMIYQQLMTRRPEVFVEVEFLQVVKQRDTNFGIDLQTMTQIVNFGGLLNSTVPESITSAFRGFLTFGGGLTLFGIGVTDSRVFASMTDSQTRLVQNATLRSLDNQQATLHVGSRFPIMTQGYFGAPVTGDEQVFRPPPTIQFEDLGLSLKITPRVHGTDEVTLNVESEFKVLTGQTSNGIPVISNRKFLGQVRLRAGEWAVAAGLMSRENTKGYTGIAGLSEIPLIGTALRNNNRSKMDTDVLLVLKPRILHPGPAFDMPPPLWVGTETKALPPI
jgi:general secretion pathway protein D